MEGGAQKVKERKSCYYGKSQREILLKVFSYSPQKLFDFLKPDLTPLLSSYFAMVQPNEGSPFIEKMLSPSLRSGSPSMITFSTSINLTLPVSK